MFKFPSIAKVTVWALSLVIMAGCAKKGADEASIQIKGSDTELNLVQRLAEVYMKKNPQVTIAITGGGSGVGIVALIDKQTDIANSSRTMKDEEIKRAKAKGVDPVAIIFALDGLAVIVHQGLPVDSLSLDEVAKIFKGEITNWKDVGGNNLDISLYGRTSASGTYVYFRDNVLKGDYSPKMKGMVGTGHIVEAIKKDNSGIGYAGIGYVVDEEGKLIPGVKALNIARDVNSPAVTPLKPENVNSGLYPLSRPLYQYTDGKPKGKILEFIQFELSDEGQEFVFRQGYYPVPPQYIEANRKLGIVE